MRCCVWFIQTHKCSVFARQVYIMATFHAGGLQTAHLLVLGPFHSPVTLWLSSKSFTTATCVCTWLHTTLLLSSTRDWNPAPTHTITHLMTSSSTWSTTCRLEYLPIGQKKRATLPVSWFSTTTRWRILCRHSCSRAWGEVIRAHMTTTQKPSVHLFGQTW